MAFVICDMSVSLDGYVTGPNDNRENPFGDGAGILHDWLSGAATGDDRVILDELIDGTGAVVMGRKSFDKNEGEGGWGEGGPLSGEVKLPEQKGDAVGTVMMHNAASADGFIADEKKHVGRRQAITATATSSSPIAWRWRARRRAPCLPSTKRGRRVPVKTRTTPATPSTTSAREPRHIMPRVSW